MANQANQATTIIADNNDFIVFQATLIHTLGAEDNVHSRAIEMRGLTPVGGSIAVNGLTVESARDVNLFLQGANDAVGTNFASFYTRPGWDDFSAGTAGTKAIFATEIFQDAADLAPVTVDVNAAIVLTDPAFNCRYIRFQSDGQSSNPVTASTIIQLKLNKIVSGFRYKPSYIVSTS